MNKTILITGAGGLIGKSLTNLLLEKGYTVYHLSRNEKDEASGVRVFMWDVYSGKIDEECIKGVDTIIHLAGEGIADKAWTKRRKEQIIKSRTDSIKLIFSILRKNPHNVKTLISASGINYYSDDPDKLRTEKDNPGTGFLSRVCVKWEDAADEGKTLGLRTVKLRTGIVLDKEGGALPKIAFPVKYGLGAALGSGKQWVSWIHLEDAVKMYLFAVETDLEGTYNMCAPQPVTNRDMTKILAQTLNKLFWMPSIPAFALKIVLGELSSTVLSSVKASSERIQKEGFDFTFPTLQSALADIYIKE